LPFSKRIEKSPPRGIARLDRLIRKDTCKAISFFLLSQKKTAHVTMKDWLLKQKRIQKILAFFKKSTSPKVLALSTAIGLLLGLFPILGTTTIIITGLGLLFRLNLPLMMALSYLVYPVQLLLIIPFIRFGEWLFGEPGTRLTLDALRAASNESLLGALTDLWSANVCGAFGWAALAIPTGLLLYKMLLMIFGKKLERAKE
jgi:uncharacterized protein (DUF2062 family)